MSGELLADKSIPKPKLVQAVILGVGLIGTTVFTLNQVSTELENHFHLFHAHHSDADVKEIKAHPLLLFGLVACFPVLSMLCLALVLPIGPYVSDHAPFQSLNILRPDHYFRVLVAVYSNMMGNNGKLAAKDL